MLVNLSISAFLFEETWQGWNTNQMSTALSQLREGGVSEILTEAWRYRDDLIDAVHDEGMRFWAGVSCFSDHNGSTFGDRTRLHPVTDNGSPRAQMEWYTGLIPTDAEYNDWLVQQCRRIVTEHDVDGIGLDFIRWPLHWELELRPEWTPRESSFDSLSLECFRRDTGVPLPGGMVGVDAAEWIRRHAAQEWVDFKCWTISTVASRIAASVRQARPGVVVGAYVVPGDDEQRRVLLGQDVAKLATTCDELLPMMYHRMVHQDEEWIGSVVHQIATHGTNVRPVVQVSADERFSAGADWGDTMSVNDAAKAVSVAIHASQSQRVAIFPGEALLLGPEAPPLRNAIVRALHNG